MSQMICPNSRCRHEWVPRVPDPKACPRCHRFLKGLGKEDTDSEIITLGHDQDS